MERKKKVVWGVLFIAILVLFLLWRSTQIQGAEHARSYTNAKEFYNSTGYKTGKHIDVVNGTIYFATKGRLANTYAVDRRTYYDTVGFDVELTGAGESLVFSVKTGVSLEEVPGSHVLSEEGDGMYSYVLYHITADNLEMLAKNADKEKAEKIFQTDVIGVRMDSIVIRIHGGMRGNIEEDGKGGLHIYRPNNDYEWVWRIRDDAQLRDVESVFGGHYFREDQNITAELENYKLDIYYAVDGLPEKSMAGSTHVTVDTGMGYGTADDTLKGVKIPYILVKENVLYKESNRITNSMTLLLPSTIDMKKTGYHIDKEVKGKEWITADNRTFAAGGTYRPTELLPECGYKDNSVCFYANWKPNTYEIIYHPNGGDGVMESTKVSYDEEFSLKECILSKSGYYFGGWATTPSGEVVYEDKQSGLKNLTEQNEGEIHLYAVWVAEIVTITLDHSGADYAGTEVYYEKYGVGNYEDKECKTPISTIILPFKKGHEFEGYYLGISGVDVMPYVTETGEITSNATTFIEDTILYAKWSPRTYEVRFDKQGGIYGSDSVKVVYKKTMPRADAPVRTGYKFQGYYTQKNGK